MARYKNPKSLPKPLAGPLTAAAALSPDEVKPEALADNRPDKKNYAQRLSNELASLVAACLRPSYKRARITPFADGSGQEFSVGAKIDSKRTDVGVWDDAAGLILGISIKTYSFRDYHGAADGKPARLGRYQRNVKRNDMELRDEADVLHRRQPYAVLVALFFLPMDACWDGATGHSSFAHSVFTFRKRSGRLRPDDRRSDLFERVYIGLYADDGSVGFFDVLRPPPHNQPPSDLLSLAELVEEMERLVEIRNEGVSAVDRYAVDDPGWTVPAIVPVDEPPLTFEETLDTALGEDDDFQA